MNQAPPSPPVSPPPAPSRQSAPLSSVLIGLLCFIAGGFATSLAMFALSTKAPDALRDQHGTEQSQGMTEPAHATTSNAVAPTVTTPATSLTPSSSVSGGKDTVSLAPVADVNGVVITLRDMEDALLKKEGVEEVEKKLHSLLEITDWSRLKDDDLIVATKFGRVQRRDLAVDLLKEKGADVREDLIELTLLNQAMNAESIVFDKQAIDVELGRMEKRLQDELEKRHQPVSDLRTAIRQKENMSLEDFVRTAAFKMLTGMHLLVQHRAEKEVGEEELRKFFDEHIDNYQVKEAVDLSDIYLPFPKQKGHVNFAQEDRDRRVDSAMAIYNLVRKQEMTFEKIFRTFDAQHDQNADGHIGWVPRSGQVGKRGNRTLPTKVMDLAFSAQPPFPNLLPPIEHDDGIDIVIVHGRRDTQQPIFTLLHEKILTDLVDSQIEARTDKLRLALRRAATINYASLPPLIEARERPVPDVVGSVPVEQTPQPSHQLPPQPIAK